MPLKLLGVSMEGWVERPPRRVSWRGVLGVDVHSRTLLSPCGASKLAQFEDSSEVNAALDHISLGIENEALIQRSTRIFVCTFSGGRMFSSM